MVNPTSKSGLAVVETDFWRQASTLSLIANVENGVVFHVVGLYGISIVGITVLHDIDIIGRIGVIVLEESD